MTTEPMKKSRVIIEFESSNIGLKKAINSGAVFAGIEFKLGEDPEKLQSGENEWAIEVARGKVEDLRLAVQTADKIMQGVRVRVVEVIRPSCLPDTDIEF